MTVFLFTTRCGEAGPWIGPASRAWMLSPAVLKWTESVVGGCYHRPVQQGETQDHGWRHREAADSHQVIVRAWLPRVRDQGPGLQCLAHAVLQPGHRAAGGMGGSCDPCRDDCGRCGRPLDWPVFGYLSVPSRAAPSFHVRR